MKKFIFTKFVGLKAYSRESYYQMKSFTGILWQHFKPPMLPPCIDLTTSHQILKSHPEWEGAQPPMFSTPVENPDIGANNYPFQWFLSFLTLKLHQVFTKFSVNHINHKSCILSHNFSHTKKMNLIRKRLTKFRFKTRLYTQRLVKWSWHGNVSHTEI